MPTDIKAITDIKIANIDAAIAGQDKPITVMLTDKNGQPISGVANKLEALIGTNSAITDKFIEQKNNGIYTATLKGQHAGSHIVKVSAKGSHIIETQTWEVKTNTVNVAAGNAGDYGVVSDVTLTPIETTVAVSNELTITVEVNDIFNNTLKGIKKDKVAIKLGTEALVLNSWEDHLNGTYTAKVTPNKITNGNLSMQIGNKISGDKHLSVIPDTPVFEAGKSELSISSDSIEANGKNSSTVILVLKNKYSKPILGQKPALNIASRSPVILTATSKPGVYTAAITSARAGEITLTLDGNSINYKDTAPSTHLYFYSFIDIESEKGHPTNVIGGATLKLTLSKNNGTQYDWKSDRSWVSVNNGVLKFEHKPSAAEKTFTITGIPKQGSHLTEAVRYTLSVKNWFQFSSPTTGEESNVNKACQDMGLSVASYDEAAGFPSSLRKEWGTTIKNYSNTNSAWLNHTYYNARQAFYLNDVGVGNQGMENKFSVACISHI